MAYKQRSHLEVGVDMDLGAIVESPPHVVWIWGIAACLSLCKNCCLVIPVGFVRKLWLYT